MKPNSVRPLLKQAYRHLPFKRPVFELARALLPVPERLYRHLHFEGPFTVKVENGRSFIMEHRGSVVENGIFWKGIRGGWERTSMSVWLELCRDQSGWIADIGANSGVYALAAAAMAPDAQIVAFEPVPRVADWLRANGARNGSRLRIEEQAVSDSNGSQRIHDIMAEHNYSASLEGQGPGAATYEVRTCRLDDYLAAAGAAAVGPVKIDVERHEPAVLRGMAATLRECRPAVLIEILDDTIGKEVWESIDGLGYRCFGIDEDRGLIPLDRPRPVGGEDWNNLLCTAAQFDAAGLDRFLAD